MERIAQIDAAGPTLNSVICLNPKALEEAAALDAHWAQTQTLVGPLHGIPILLKDNINTRKSDGMRTTAGSLALLELWPEEDAPIVARLRAAGAVILGKTNLSEWANFRSSNSVSGWSAVGGLTRNP
ncbi:amidase family protein, partial [Arthrospira platensis SPKY1]|nr:amidase family protein [Arthrospira platensis SPKY1]